MVRVPLPVLLVMAFVLAGCASEPAAAPDVAGPDAMEIRGLVRNGTTGVPDATVLLVGEHRSTRTDADGTFRLPDLPKTAHVLQVSAPGFSDAVVQVPGQDIAVLDIALYPPAPHTPPPAVVRFRGHLQCTAEALIISGPCDVLLTYAGQDGVFDGTNVFQLAAPAGWATMVGYLDFDASPHPAMAGMRVTVRAQGDANDTLDYVQYGRFYDAASFEFRMAPGGTYTDGSAPVPDNATTFQFEVYPHSHGYHEACIPETPAYPATCFLGGAAAARVDFELLVALFVGPVPDGWSILEA